MKTHPLKIFIKMSLMLQLILFFCFAGCSSGNKIIPADYTDRQSGFGAEVIVETINGIEYSGELLSVRDSVIFVCDKYGATETDLARGIYPVREINNEQITLIAVKGKKLYITGLFIGGAIGAALGAAVGSTAGRDSEDKNNFIFPEPTKGQCIVGGACLLGLAGAGIGALIGAAGSSEDRIIYNSVEPSQIDYEFLKRFARYPEEVPNYVPAFRQHPKYP